MKIIIEKDAIDAFGTPGDTGPVFMAEFFSLNWNDVLLTDNAELSDFCHHYPSPTSDSFENSDSDSLQASGKHESMANAAIDHKSIANETIKSLVAKWDAWMIAKVFDRYGVKLETTRINLVSLFRLIEASPHHGEKPLLH